MKTRLAGFSPLVGLQPPCPASSGFRFGWLLVAMISWLGVMAGAPTAFGASAFPPDRMTYQGYLVDANGQPLAPTNPANYPAIFRIYDQATGGTNLWSEQQIVTIDKGNFSVLLGEGSDFGSEARPALSSVFAGDSASDRFIGITVTIDGTSLEILPRLRLLPAAYSFLSRYANGLVGEDGVPVVTALATAGGAELTVGGKLTANEFVGTGTALADLDANKMTTGVLNPARVPLLDGSKIGSGTVSDDRLSSNIPRQSGSASFAGSVSATGGFVGNGTIPLGGIIMWSGALSAIPSGWALCDGRTVSGRTTPNLSNRFIVSVGSSYGVGSTGGQDSTVLSVSQLPPHSHSYQDHYFAESSGGGISGNTYIGPTGWRGSGDTDSDNVWLWYRNFSTANAGSGSAIENRPAYYALAFIMRVQ